MLASDRTTTATGLPLIRAFFARYGRRYLAVYGLGILFLLATNGLTVAIPRLLKEVFDQLATTRDVASIELFVALISMAAVLVIIVRTMSRILFFNPGRTIEFRLRNDMLERLLSMSAGDFRKHALGDLVSRAANDATHVRALVGFSVLMLLNLVMAAGFAFWQMFETHARLTLFCMIPMALSVFLMRYSVQSLYRIVASRLGKAIPSNLVLLGLCAFFGLLLLGATRRQGDSIFVLGLLFYTAFVLIGPQSSKPHFIAFFGLLLFCWQDALLNRSWLKGICLASLSGLLGVKAVAGLLPAGPLARDLVGLAGFALWLYSYMLLMISGHSKPLSLTKT